MILSTMLIVGGGLSLGLTRRGPIFTPETARVLREAYGDTATAPVPRPLQRLTQRIEPVLRIVRSEES